MRLYKEICLYELIWFETKKNPNDESLRPDFIN